MFRRRQQEGGDATVDSIGSVIERVAGASVTEIERVMAELSTVRDMLRNEGERVQREITGYASLSQTAMTSMKIIGDSLRAMEKQAPQAAAQGLSQRHNVEIQMAPHAGPFSSSTSSSAS